MKFFIALFVALPISLTAQVKDTPKLVVGIVVDQMCYDYLYRFESKYGKNGLLKLRDKGLNCHNTNYNYVPTYTGPGHASIYTGTTPATHGIVANDWYERSIGREINCVEDTTVNSVGTSSAEGKCSPHHLKVHTITDQLKLARNGAKVISASIKDRGAILPGGHLSDGSYWYDYSSGNFVSSTFFMNNLPQWVQDFNALPFVEESMKQTWDTRYPISTYTEGDVDDRKYEHLLPGKTTPTFPYNLGEMIASSGVSPYDLFTSTPFANTFLTDFALQALENESLGQDGITDMLTISYSTPDIMGHAFGPYSIEIEDCYIRLDEEIARLISALEKKVGKKNFVLFLTADHAVVPVPQYLVDKQLPGGYFFLDTLMSDLRALSVKNYGEDLIVEQTNLNLYLNTERIEALNLDSKRVARDFANALRGYEGIKEAFTFDELSHHDAASKWMAMVAKGYNKSHSGEVIFILEPGYLPKSAPNEKTHKGTSHGSAYSYDSHVPLLWYGAGIPKCSTLRAIEITDISATLTHIMRLQQPSNIEGEPILELLND